MKVPNMLKNILRMKLLMTSVHLATTVFVMVRILRNHINTLMKELLFTDLVLYLATFLIILPIAIIT